MQYRNPEYIWKLSDTIQPNQNIWDNIERIEQLLAHSEKLSDTDRNQIQKLLFDIQTKTENSDWRLRSFFNDHIWEKLQKMFPGIPLLDQDLPQFSDSLDLLIDWKEAFSEIVKQIDAAQNLIEIHIFIWRNDTTGQILARKILDAVNDPSRPNLRVKIIKDSVGGIFEHAEQNKQSFFHPNLSLPLAVQSKFVDSAYDNKNEAKNNDQHYSVLKEQILTHPDIQVVTEKMYDHSKYYIFDSKTVITGWMNIWDEYLSWHDYMIKMDNSPLLVEKLKQRISWTDDFDSWSSLEFSVNRWKKSWAYLDMHNNFWESKQLPEKEIKTKILEILDYAERHNEPVTIEMAYFGDRDITDKIIKMLNAGVKMNIILPANANVQDDLNKREISRILDESLSDNNLTVALYPEMLHAKMIHIWDLDSWLSKSWITFFGSANLNKKATEDLAELNVIIDDNDCNFTKEVKLQLIQDLQKSTIIKAPPKITFSHIKSWFESVV